ncbi:hypothetical protein TGME49_278890 [Toxoplasma gondii ME49]|uniref:Protein CASP n=2 Tax=Toxoplasma gondii TaxID=5811 RepID=B6KRW9_TOXGV|nr:hypothetical protein TGME49_278890 [Toxoplasma gondii ME49]EPT25276.1 hypothetical protein TGME49_278890 [Toxoplasma gondii ME49]ESS34584.1 CASP carboxy-terminal protein [Toxoplasma gondii VEG]CEL78730.1 TPA: hypothetical protein BN1205_029510 [Toxoplasma gondii VEG]|eukprot:XP_002370592.1 hypothetical protein TGME49_278890 [Toxoplasma gondii ME49]
MASPVLPSGEGTPQGAERDDLAESSQGLSDANISSSVHSVSSAPPSSAPMQPVCSDDAASANLASSPLSSSSLSSPPLASSPSQGALLSGSAASVASPALSASPLRNTSAEDSQNSFQPSSPSPLSGEITFKCLSESAETAQNTLSGDAAAASHPPPTASPSLSSSPPLPSSSLSSSAAPLPSSSLSSPPLPSPLPPSAPPLRSSSLALSPSSSLSAAGGSAFPGRRLTKRGEAVQAWVSVWSQLGEFAMFSKEIERAKKQAVEARKKLASDTKKMRHLAASAEVSEAEKLQCTDTLLRAYQQEIDSLTRRAKGAEATFLSLVQLLLQQPDLIGVLQGLETDAAAALSSAAAAQEAALVDEEHQRLLSARLQTAEDSLREERTARLALEEENSRLQDAFGRQSAELREELESENVLLRQQISDLEKEFRTLTNQAVTVRRLEEEREQQKRAFDHRVQLAVQEKEKQLRAQIGAKEEEQAQLTAFLQQTTQDLENRNLLLESRVADGQQQLLQLKAQSEKRCAALAGEVAMLHAQLAEAQRHERAPAALPGASSATQQSATHLRALEAAQQRIAALQQEERRLRCQLEEAERERENHEKARQAEREREVQMHARQVAELQQALRERPTEKEFLLLRQRVRELEGGVVATPASSLPQDAESVEASLRTRIGQLEALVETREKEHRQREEDLKRRIEDEQKQHREVVCALENRIESEGVRDGFGDKGPRAGEEEIFTQKEDRDGGEREARTLPSMLQVLLRQREQSRARVAALEEELEATKSRLSLQQQEVCHLKSQAAHGRVPLPPSRETQAPLLHKQSVVQAPVFPAGHPGSGASAVSLAGGEVPARGNVREGGDRSGAEAFSRRRRPRNAEERRQDFVGGLLAVAQGVARAATQTAASVWGEKKNWGPRRKKAGKACVASSSGSGGTGSAPKRFSENDEEAGLGGAASSDEMESDWGATSPSSSDEEQVDASRAGVWNGLAGAGPRRREEGRRKKGVEIAPSSLSLLPDVCSADARFTALREGREEHAFLSRLQTLSGAERIVVIWGRLLLSCRATRLFALFYFVLLHFLVFLVLFYHADLQSRGQADQAGSHQPRYHYYLNE